MKAVREPQAGVHGVMQQAYTGHKQHKRAEHVDNVVLLLLHADGTHLTDPDLLARYTGVYGPPMAPQHL